MSHVSRSDIDSVFGPLEFDLSELKKRYDRERDARIRATGNDQYVAAVDGRFEDFSRDPWVAPGFSRAPLSDHTEIIIAGGGFGGLLAGARLHEAGFSDIRVVEEAGDFGGTWYWNRYPGAMCDVEAHIYMPLLEELNHAPRHRYAYADEMLEVSRKIGHRYGLYEKACFQTVITAAHWREDEKHWLIETNRGDRLTATYLVLACGRQSLPKLPGIAGLGRFKGHVFHSSRWDYAYTGGSESNTALINLRDKRVGIIGTGATAVQIVPEVGKWAKDLIVFQRTPSAVGIRGQKATSPTYADMTKPGWQKTRRENFQKIILGIPQDANLVDDGWTDTIEALKPMPQDELARRLGREPTNEERELAAQISDYRVMNTLRERVSQTVKDPATAEALKAWYRWMCKRPCFHDDYLETFNRPNVKLVDTYGLGVDAFTERAVVVDGKEYEVDCIIVATGFEAGIPYVRLIGFDPVGRGGIRLSDHWRDGVRTLHGMTTDRFPNCFLVGNNQQTVAAFNAVHLLDEQAVHLAHMLKEMRQRRLETIEAKTEAVNAYSELVRSAPANKAQVSYYMACTPGYYNGEGAGTRTEDLFFGNRYGDGAVAFYELLANWRCANDFEGMIVL